MKYHVESKGTEKKFRTLGRALEHAQSAESEPVAWYRMPVEAETYNGVDKEGGVVAVVIRKED